MNRHFLENILQWILIILSIGFYLGQWQSAFNRILLSLQSVEESSRLSLVLYTLRLRLRLPSRFSSSCLREDLFEDVFFLFIVSIDNCNKFSFFQRDILLIRRKDKGEDEPSSIKARSSFVLLTRSHRNSFLASIRQQSRTLIGCISFVAFQLVLRCSLTKVLVSIGAFRDPISC